jgi:hypothetical protein
MDSRFRGNDEKEMFVTLPPSVELVRVMREWIRVELPKSLASDRDD